MDLVLKLREIRRLRGLSQKDVARLSGVGEKTISSFETGQRIGSLKLAQLKRMLGVYGLTEAEFFGGSVERQIAPWELDDEESAAQRLVEDLRELPQAGAEGDGREVPADARDRVGRRSGQARRPAKRVATSARLRARRTRVAHAHLAQLIEGSCAGGAQDVGAPPAQPLTVISRTRAARCLHLSRRARRFSTDLHVSAASSAVDAERFASNMRSSAFLRVVPGVRAVA